MNYIVVFLFIAIFKVVIYAVFVFDPKVLFSGGNDADYYDAFALGADLVTSSAWPSLLRALNEFGLYSRISTSFVIMLLSVFVIPLLCGRLSALSSGCLKNRIYLLVPVIVSLYPTLYYYGLDIYRDVFMVFLFLIGLLLVRSVIASRKAMNKLVLVGLVFVLGYVMYLFRGYLGFAFIVAFLGFWFLKFKNYSFLYSVVPAMVLLNGFFALGYLGPIMEYRDLFDGVESATNLNIRFDSVWFFLPDFISNFFIQMLGAFFPNKTAVFVFAFESLPFIFALAYVVYNRQYANSFVDFLVLFFVVYSTIWLLGNDNLGTAMRLRMYSYLCVVISCVIIFQRKKEIKFQSSFDDRFF